MIIITIFLAMVTFTSHIFYVALEVKYFALLCPKAQTDQTNVSIVQLMLQIYKTLCRSLYYVNKRAF